jgi:hypothetical protein
MFASRLLLLVVGAHLLAVGRSQKGIDSPDPGKEEGFKDLITENNLDEK